MRRNESEMKQSKHHLFPTNLPNLATLFQHPPRVTLPLHAPANHTTTNTLKHNIPHQAFFTPPSRHNLLPQLKAPSTPPSPISENHSPISPFLLRAHLPPHPCPCRTFPLPRPQRRVCTDHLEGHRTLITLLTLRRPRNHRGVTGGREEEVRGEHEEGGKGK